MDLSRHINALQTDLSDAAALGGEEIAAAGRKLAAAAGAALQLRLLDLLSEASLELNSQFPDGHVELRLAGREPELVYVAQTPAEPSPTADAPAESDARITLRLPDGVKAAAEAAADAEGISTNAWILRALKRELEQRSRGRVKAGNRLQGFVQS
jgi:predicted HicB family RNase H-like nuclease